MSFFRPSNQTRRERAQNREDWTLGAIFGSLDFASDGVNPWYIFWGGWRFFAGALLAMAVIGAIYFGVTEILFPPEIDPAVQQIIDGAESGSVTSSTLPDADVADVLAQFGG